MAGSSIITCPECQKKFKPKGDLSGKKIRCPFCREVFRVPAEEAAEIPAASKTPAGGKKKPAPEPKPAPSPPPFDDEFNDSNPYGVTTLDSAPRCPNCANEMESEEAVICLHCGYNTQTRTWGKTEKVIALTAGEHLVYLLPALACAVLVLGQFIGILYFCLILPDKVGSSFLSFLDHESMRVWGTALALFIIWPMGYYAFDRLVLKPKPPDKIKE